MSRVGRATDAAIVGMACRFPGAGDLVAFWENILSGVDAITDVPADRWDPAAYFGPGAPRRGGYLAGPIAFDPARHGVMPRAVAGGEPEQFLVLDAARAALLDAGLPDGPADGRRVEMAVARGNYFNRGNLTRLSHGRILEQTRAILESLHPEWTAEERAAVRADLRSHLPPFEGATIPGQLTNATAGRVADRLDLHGASYVVDAASASALVALDLAARSLKEGRADLALVGAVYLEADVDFPLVFDRLGALSKSGRARPFAADADGLLSGEGVGVVVLKRLRDAERDGNRVYAVVRGVGVASDGRGAGLAAPSARGHARAIRRAYRAARVDPADVGLIEGHGLGLPAADRAEIRALRATFPPSRPGRRSLGAVSSMIGHAMPAAGMAGLIKAALALHHRVIPPTLHAETPHPALLRPDSPASLAAKARPWVHGSADRPRFAGVNAFGFAGINAHAVLAAHPASDDPDAPGALEAWETEAFLLTGADRFDLADRAEALARQLRVRPDVAPKDLAAHLNSGVDVLPRARLGLVAATTSDLIARIEAAVPKLRDPACRSIRDARGAYFWDPGDRRAAPRVAFLFPGEGSQYPGMLGDLAPHFPEVRELLDTSDRLARAGRTPAEDAASPWPSESLYGPESGALWSAEVAVNVILSAQWALYQLLLALKIVPDAVMGHSSGEFLALAAAGALTVDRAFEDGLGSLGAVFGRLEAGGDLPAARLVAVAADRARVEAAVAELGQSGAVEVAMDNCPHQVVIAGDPAGVDAVAALMKSRGAPCEVLPFARAYHTEAFAPAVGPIREFFRSTPIRPPATPLYSCAEGRRMPADPAAIRELAVAQWTRRVEFRPGVEAMFGDGIEVFVDVGARGNLAGFVEDTLRGKPALAVAANLPRRSGPTQLNHLVAVLFARGVDLDPAHLYTRRRPKAVDLDAPPSDRGRPAATLAVGFPAMRLSDGLIARLRARPEAEPDEPARNGHHGSNGHHEAMAPAGGDDRIAGPDLDPPGTPIPGWPGSSDPGGWTNHHEDRGRETPATQGRQDAQLRTNLGEDQPCGPDDAAATLLDFQRTMTEFLAMQQAVVGAYLGGEPAIDFEPAEANGHAGDLDPDFDLGEIAFHLGGAPEPPAAPSWAGELVALDPGRSAAATYRLDAAGDPVAEHHTLGGRRISAVQPDWRGLPVLPFAVMAEMLAQGAGRLAPAGWVLVALRDVRAHRWIRYEEEGASTLEVRAEAVAADPGRFAARAAIHDRGKAVFEGVAVFAPARLDPVPAPAFGIDDARPCRFTAASIYDEQWLFHGPALQAVAAIGPIAAGGIAGELAVLPLGPLLRDPESAGRLHTDPVILDNFTHLLGGWGLDELADRGDVIFPLRMGALTLFGDRPAEGSRVACQITVEESERHRIAARADIVRPDGTTWMRIEGWEDWRFHWPGRYRDGFRAPDRTFLGEPLAPDGLEPQTAAAVWLEPPGDMRRPVWRDVLEHVQLGPDERAAMLALPGPDARRTHRLWGRVAAKEAARRVWANQGAAPTYPADLLVVPDAAGRPTLLDRRDPARVDLPAVSIAHAEGVAVALAVDDPAAWLGVDVEPIVERPAGFEAAAFTALERAALDRRSREDGGRAEWSARLWCAKEAAAKATGLGFVDGPSGAEVVAIGDDGVVGVALRGELADACRALAGRTIRVATDRRGDFIWAWTIGEEFEP